MTGQYALPSTVNTLQSATRSADSHKLSCTAGANDVVIRAFEYVAWRLGPKLTNVRGWQTRAPWYSARSSNRRAPAAANARQLGEHVLAPRQHSAGPAGGRADEHVEAPQVRLVASARTTSTERRARRSDASSRRSAHTGTSSAPITCSSSADTRPTRGAGSERGVPRASRGSHVDQRERGDLGLELPSVSSTTLDHSKLRHDPIEFDVRAHIRGFVACTWPTAGYIHAPDEEDSEKIGTA
jgi:hypothetical protein